MFQTISHTENIVRRKTITVPRDAVFRYWKVCGDRYAYEGEGPFRTGHVGAATTGGKMPGGRVYITDIVIDIDDREEPMIKVPLSRLPMDCYDTGSGWHLHIPVWAAMTEQEADDLYTLIKAAVRGMRGVDMASISYKRAIRTEGTPSLKTGRPKRKFSSNRREMEMLDYEAVLNRSREKIDKWRKKSETRSTKGAYVSKTLVEIARNGIGKGETKGGITGRNTAAYIMTGSLLNLGYDKETVARFMAEWNRRLPTPLNFFELQNACRAVMNGVAAYGSVDYEGILEKMEEAANETEKG
ncbi:MAG: hypothetical protein KatS3mg104_2928 [Phycisphaerae bacterium]|nr:MAG: hypothetical protein KatS3mg104_2928 [Phycisphaerae bacterium]